MNIDHNLQWRPDKILIFFLRAAATCYNLCHFLEIPQPMSFETSCDGIASHKLSTYGVHNSL
jgi:hypothetical protein